MRLQYSGRPPDLVDVAEIDHRIDPLAVEVQAEGDQVDVARPLTVAEQAPLDPVRAGQHRQLGVGDRCAPVVVGVHAQRHMVAMGQVSTHPFDLIGVHVRGRSLHRAGQVRMISRPASGCHTSITAEVISSEKSSSVSMKISGEYS